MVDVGNCRLDTNKALLVPLEPEFDSGCLHNTIAEPRLHGMVPSEMRAQNIMSLCWYKKRHCPVVMPSIDANQAVASHGWQLVHKVFAIATSFDDNRANSQPLA